MNQPDELESYIYFELLLCKLEEDDVFIDTKTHTHVL